MPYATLDELKGRLDWNLDDELRIAVGHWTTLRTSRPPTAATGPRTPRPAW
ncbi:hypothetical protein [Streptomyces mirabilis]|uniref:hypothetical protein n=1 Tax=Streptomyces mirabilis TaxID=68239 RepID=UPI0036D040F3